MEKKQVTLKSGIEVTFKKDLTWFDVQRIETALSNKSVYRKDESIEFNGDATLEAKLVLLEVTIEKAVEKEKAIPVTREWIKSLSYEDGKTLHSAADEVAKQIQGKKE